MQPDEPPTSPQAAVAAPHFALQRAQHFLEAQRPDLAEHEVTRALVHAPDNAELHFMLGLTHSQRDQHADAGKCFERALELEPEHGRALAFLGLTRAEEGRYPEAERLMLEALRVDPTDALVYRLYAQLMQRTGHLEKAERLHRKALQLDPESASGHALLSTIEAERNRLGSAAHHSQRALALEPEQQVAHISAGVHALNSGRPFAARRALREALRIDPSNAELEELWLEADRCCRVVYLPMYYWSLALRRLPGRQFAVWGAMIALFLAAKNLGWSPVIFGSLALFYAAFCIYTWLATPLVKAWIKLRPAR